GIYQNVNDAARKLDIWSQQYTVRHRMNGTTQERQQAHQDQELLTLAQNKVLKAWAKWLGMVGFPVSRKTMVPKMKLLCGR
ncbi:hypothetical protein ARMSODRAFT_840367, partial [Armillaria solidipes]